MNKNTQKSGYFFYEPLIKFIMNSARLIDAKKNREYKIKSVENLDLETSQYLTKLGFVAGEAIELKYSNYKKGSYLVKVMGISYMLDKVICENIIIEDE